MANSSSRHSRWRQYFDQAAQETEGSLRLSAINLAIQACLHDFEAASLDLSGIREKQRILVAMADLKVLRAACVAGR